MSLVRRLPLCADSTQRRAAVGYDEIQEARAEVEDMKNALAEARQG
jgi:hypothetical protein